MTLDSSALLAILFSEPGSLDLVDRILEAEAVRIGAPTLVEACMVFAARQGRESTQHVGELIAELGVTIVPFAEPEWHAAVSAFQRYGRGRHRAGLNFGDCLAYATAAVAGDSLTGNDFRLTDIAPGT